MCRIVGSRDAFLCRQGWKAGLLYGGKLLYHVRPAIDNGKWLRHGHVLGLLRYCSRAAAAPVSCGRYADPNEKRGGESKQEDGIQVLLTIRRYNKRNAVCPNAWPAGAYATADNTPAAGAAAAERSSDRIRINMDTLPLPTSAQTALDIQELIHAAGGSPNADLLTACIETLLRARDLERGDLKLLHRTIRELRYAFSVFSAYRMKRKVSVFGSARTPADAPINQVARTFARRMTEAGFMVITGAGDGIMHAAQEGAGRDNSFGLNILLPFEQGANPFIANDPKLIYFKYFFTRKLLFVKETHAVALFPGGFGTHDEAFEALTLLQTGKSTLMPVVFLDVPGGTYWQEWYAYVQEHMLSQGLISPSDLHLFRITDDVEAAVSEISTFYSNFHSMRYVAGKLLIRLQRPVTDAILTQLNGEFQDILTQGEIVSAAPIEHDPDDMPELARICLWFDRVHYGRLRQMINVLNQYA
jgi:uncharacterized protein (TIGR00730 family)